MPKASKIHQATKTLATLKQQGHTVKAMEVYDDKIRFEFAVSSKDFDDDEYNELDYIDWKMHD
jgi:hypothetical protein